jgi:hypothetical protein
MHMTSPCKWKLIAYRAGTGEIVRATCVNSASSFCGMEATDVQCAQCDKSEPPAAMPLPPRPNITKPHRHRRDRTTSDEAPPKEPSLAKRILTYTEAVAEWIAAGRPERTDEEVQRIFKEHCEKCNWRKRRSNICRGCGCRVVSYGMAVTNKLKMATQHCPRSKW